MSKEINTLKTKRATVKTLLSKTNSRLTEECSLEHLSIYEKNIDEYKTRYDAIQDELDVAVPNEDLSAQEDYRFEIYEQITAMKVLILEKKNTLTQIHNLNCRSTTNESNNSSKEALICTTSNLNFVPYQEDETFSNFVKRLETFMKLKGYMDNVLKVYVLLHALTPLMHERLYDICSPDEPTSKPYEELVDLLKQYYEPKTNIWALQNKFVNRMQEPNESVMEFSTALKKLSQQCEFKCENCSHCISNSFLTLQFIRGLQDSDIRIKLLQEKHTSTFKDFIEKATIIEYSKSENEKMHGNHPSNSQNLNQMKQGNLVSDGKNNTYNSKYPERKPKTKPTQTTLHSLAGKCYRCGNEDHRANVCKFRDEICSKCKKVGHIARVCMSQSFSQSPSQTSKKSHQINDHNPSGNEYEVNLLQTEKSDKFMVNVHIEDKPIYMEIDTGAALTSISFSDYKKLHLQNRIFNTNIQMKTYTGETIKPKGVCFVTCKYKGQTFVGKLFIINQDVDPIFGRDWIRETNLDWAEIKCLKSEECLKLEEILKKYEALFTDKIGTVPNERGHYQLKNDVTPIFFKPRPIPYARKKKIEDELNRLENQGIITKVEHSEWGTPIVPIEKPNGDIRICADYKVTLNKCIHDFNYPIPKIDDMFAQMNGGKFFCTLDLNKAYLHYQMDDESAMLQCLSTHKGLYRVNRLMFGVKVAPGLWQRYMDKLFQGITGVQCFFDDIVIQGSTYNELLQRLNKVLETIKSQNLTLNRDKCRFLQRSITYLGHKIDEHGLHKIQDKVLAIRNARRPENVTELRVFLGLANYYNKFISNLATLLNPLTQLLHKGRKFAWTKACENSFIRVKEEISNDNVLVHYNPDLPIILATDASPVGLGAVISHRFPDGSEKPIAFASRSLTKSEMNYSQIDKEATSIFWGVKKFFQYLYGRKFTLITDSKPLTSIFNPNKTLPALSATRMLHYALFLSGFDYKIEYKRTSDHGNADFLSRFPYEKPDSYVLDEAYKFQSNQLNTFNSISLQTIHRETINDKNLRPILEALQNGKCLQPFGFDTTEITLQDGCLFKGTRVMIPQTLQQEILNELHIGHLGIIKMKSLGRMFCYWRNMDKDIENMVRKCKYCCEKQNNPPKVQYHSWEPASEPWQRIHIDFFGPENGLHFFIVVDNFSKWVEVIPTKSTTTEFCIRELRRLFTTFGIPAVLVSDNGVQFTSHVFKNFLLSNGIVHKRSAVYHPSSNGQAERFVQTIKNYLHCMCDEPGDIHLKIARILMQMRKVPDKEGINSYMLMMGRDARTRLDMVMKPKISLIPNEQQSHKPSRSFEEGNRVQVRNYTRECKWAFGNIQRREGSVHYWVKLDDGRLWRRHIDQIRRTGFGGEN